MSSSSLVLELQHLASSSDAQPAELLRKALVVATKLQLAEFRAWVNSELSGYTSDANVPEYRKVRAEIKLKNPYKGLIPLYIESEEITELLCNVCVYDPIGSLIDLLRSQNSENPYLTIPLNTSQTTWILEQQEGYLQMQPIRTVGRNSVANILDAVRTAILDWSLKLEAEGILGAGMTFSPEEKRKAASVARISIQNFQGIIGNVDGSTVTQQLEMSVSPGDFSSLERTLSSSGVGQSDIAELKAAIEEEPTLQQGQPFGKRVASWLGMMMAKAASGTWGVTLVTAGNLLTMALAKYYGLSQ